MADVMRYRAMVDDVGEIFLSWVNPDLPYEMRITKDWFGMSGAFILFACTFYLALVWALMPSAEQARATAAQEAKLAGTRSAISRLLHEPVLMIQFFYNLIQVSLSSYMFLGGIKALMSTGENIACLSFDPSRSVIADILWVFYMSKLLDCCDTMFMGIRNKRNQITFLHVYHHVGTMLVFWACCAVAYDGDIYVPVVLNAFVHIIMYGYYAITSLGVPVPLFIKACVTRVQIVQFYTMLAHATMLGLPQFSCAYPQNMVYIYGAHILILLVLFTMFFLQQYRKPKSAAGVAKKYQ